MTEVSMLDDYELEDYRKIKLVIAAAQMHTNGRLCIAVLGNNPACSVVVDADTLHKVIKDLP